MSYEQIETQTEASNEAACLVAAELNRLTVQQASMCDEGHRCCLSCPWQGEGKWRQVLKGYALLDAVPYGHLFFREVLTGDILICDQSIYQDCPEVLDPRQAKSGRYVLKLEDIALSGEQAAGNARLPVWHNAVLAFMPVSDETYAAARRINKTEPAYQKEMAEALGFDSVGAMYEHQRWLAKHGSRPYRTWAEQFFPENQG